jgi:hypothetical protein
MKATSARAAMLSFAHRIIPKQTGSFDASSFIGAHCGFFFRWSSVRLVDYVALHPENWPESAQPVMALICTLWQPILLGCIKSEAASMLSNAVCKLSHP